MADRLRVSVTHLLGYPTTAINGRLHESLNFQWS